MTELLSVADYRAQLKKPAKYRNIRCVVDGIKFDSKAEARRYGELILREKARDIINLGLQIRWDFEVKGIHIGHYTADFCYYEGAGFEKLVVEDVKSKATLTEAYRLRKKLMKALHGVDIIEIS